MKIIIDYNDHPELGGKQTVFEVDADGSLGRQLETPAELVGRTILGYEVDPDGHQEITLDLGEILK